MGARTTTAVYDRVGNILLTRLMGADSRLVEDGFDIGIRKSWEDAIQSVKDAGGKPYPIPAGASVHKFGGAWLCRLLPKRWRRRNSN